MKEKLDERKPQKRSKIEKIICERYSFAKMLFWNGRE